MKSAERGATSPNTTDDVLGISQQIEQAANMRHDRATTHAAKSSTSSTASPSKSSPESTSGEKNWEMLGYPVELNPFGSDDEDEAAGIAVSRA